MLRRTTSRLLPSLKTLTLTPVPPPPHHQLQHDRPVSGTAKGKAKLKTGQQLKRNTVRTKKGSTPSSSAASSSSRGRGKKDDLDRLAQMADSCLNAPTPLRRLTEKQRKREAAREALGLISKDRQREIDLEKAKSRGKNRGDGKDESGSSRRVLMGPPGLDYITLGLVDEEEIPEYELTVEDGRRLAKEYSRVLMRRHRARQAAESAFLQLKKDAIEALPEKLKAAALVPDLTPFPANRYMATLTPPIQGYIDKVREAAQKFSVKKKLQ